MSAGRTVSQAGPADTPEALGSGRQHREVIRFAALGDSLTEGLGDPSPDGGWRGWAALLAAGLPGEGQDAELVNVARSGALSRDTAGDQLTAALEVGPHLTAVVIGANDTLRADFDIRRVARALDDCFGALTTVGAVVLTACLPDPGRMLCLPGPLARPLGRRMRAVNTVVHALSGRHRAVHIHLADHPVVEDRTAWSADRLHPSELGHRLLAREFHAALAERGLAAGPPPARTPDGPAPSRAAAAWWLATQGTAWVARRCTDLLPGLIGLAATETAHRLAGAAAAMEEHARRATKTALAEITERTAVPSSQDGRFAVHEDSRPPIVCHTP